MLGAGNIDSIDINFNTIAGYRMHSVLCAWCEGFGVVTINRYFVAEKIGVVRVHLRNISGSDADNECYASVLFVKNV